MSDSAKIDHRHSSFFSTQAEPLSNDTTQSAVIGIFALNGRVIS